jgi:hypothetical protein
VRLIADFQLPIADLIDIANGLGHRPFNTIVTGKLADQLAIGNWKLEM